MRLIQVRDNKNRPINNLDVMVGALFGDKVPKEFIPDKYYKAGERVYALDSNGNLNVWSCNISGKFKSCKEPNFSEWSLNSIIENARRTTVTTGEPINAVMYECKSAVSPRDEYMEYDGRAHFDTTVNDFSLNDYTGEGDIIDVYLRREHSDHYLRKEDYRFVGKKLSVALPLEDMTDESNAGTIFLPAGREVTDIGQEKYWYGENGKVKTVADQNINGVQVTDFDILETLGKSIEYGYKIGNLNIVSVHTVTGSPMNHTLEDDIYRLDEFEIGNHAAIGNDTEGDIQSVTVHVDIEPERGIWDELTVTYSKETQLVSMQSLNGYIQQVKFNVTMKKDKPLSIFMIGSKAISPMARFIKVLDDYGEVVEHNSEKLIKIPRFELLRYNSFEFELYVDRVFRSDYEEVADEDTGEIYIRMLNTNTIDWDNTTFLFHIFYCVTQSAAIIKTHDQKKVETERDAFRLMLTSSFVNKFQWMKMREDSKLVPPEYAVGSKNTANITNMDHYLSIGQTLKADIFSMVFKDDITRRVGSTTDICNSESYPILADTKEFVIPFLDYDSGFDDFLIFKAGGVLLSSSKWYLNGNYVNMYVHENPLRDGDYLDFRLLDRDETVRVDNYFFDVDTINNCINTGVDLQTAAFYLLFTTSGEYISSSKYTVENGVITFKNEGSDCDQPYEPYDGARVELVVGIYKHSYSKTLYKMIQIEATDEGQREFYLDESIEYNPDSDNLLIFRKDGLYIGERFYHTDATNGKIVIDKGSGVPLGSYIDILLIRNMSIRVTPDTETEEQ